MSRSSVRKQVDGRVTHRLEPLEDRELRRLHYLGGVRGLSEGAAVRYAELRARDRRRTIRAPHPDDVAGYLFGSSIPA